MNAEKRSVIQRLKSPFVWCLWKAKWTYVYIYIAFDVARLRWKQRKMAKLSAVKYQGDWAQVTVMMPKKLGEWLEKHAKEKGMSPSGLIRAWATNLCVAGEEKGKK